MVDHEDYRFISYCDLKHARDIDLFNFVRDSPLIAVSLIQKMSDLLDANAGDKTCHKHMDCPCYKEVDSAWFGKECLFAGECPRDSWENILYNLTDHKLGKPNKVLLDAIDKYVGG